MTQRKRQSTARRVAEATLDVAIGGTALAVDKAAETIDKATGRAEELLHKGRREVRERTDEAARAARSAVGEKDARPYEERSRDELYQLAAERDIEGRSSMLKAELIAALRAER